MEKLKNVSSEEWSDRETPRGPLEPSSSSSGAAHGAIAARHFALYKNDTSPARP